MEDFGTWLAKQVCDTCGAHADHNQKGKRVCYEHLDPNFFAFALND